MPTQVKYDTIVHPSTIAGLKKFWTEVAGGFKKMHTTLEKEAQGIRKSISGISPDAKGIKTLKTAQTQTEKLSKAKRTLIQTEQESLKIKKQLETAIARKNAMSTKEYAQLQKVKQSTRQMTREMNVQKGSIEALRVRTSKLVQQRDKLNLKTRQGQIAEKRLRKEIALNTAQLKRYDRQIGRNFRNVGNYASAFRNLGAAMGITMGAYGIFRVIKNSIGIISGFSQVMSKLKAVSGATDEELKLLERDSLRLGRSTQKTATEVGNLQFELAKLGFTASQILAATEAILNLSIAAGSDLAQSAEVAGQTVRAFGLDASETQRVVDVMAKSFSTSALTLGRFAEAMPNVGATAKKFGWTLERTTAILGKLVSSGIQASKAGTDLRKIIATLAKTNLTYEQALEKVRKSQNPVNTAQLLFGQRAFTSALILADLGDEVDKYTRSLDNAYGASEKMRLIMEDNLIGDVTRLKSAWEGFVLSLKNSEGTLRITIQKLTWMVNAIRLLITPKEAALLDVTFKTAKENTDFWAKSLQRLKLSTDKYNEKIDEQLEYLKHELSIYEKITKHSEQAGKKKTKEAQISIAYLKNMIELTEKLRKGEGKSPAEKTTEETTEEPVTGLIKGLDKEISDYTKLWKEATDPKMIFFYKRKVELLKIEREELEKIGEFLPKLEKLVPRELIGEVAPGMEAPEMEAPKVSFLQKILGLEPDKKAAVKRAFQTFINELQSMLSGLNAVLVDSARERVSASEELLNDLKSQLKEEQKAREDGKASNIQLLQNEIAEETRIRNKAQKDLAKAQKVQEAIDTASQVSSLITASASIIKASAKLGTVGLMLGIAAVTALVGTFAGLKMKIRKQSKEKGYAEGTEYVKRDGHPKGRDTIPIWVDEGERIISKEDNKKLGNISNKQMIDELYKWNFYKGQLPDMAQRNITDEMIDQLKRQEQIQQDTLNFMRSDTKVIDLGGGKVMIIRGKYTEIKTISNA